MPPKRKSKKIKLDVYNAMDGEDQSERLMKRRGGGGSARNFDNVETLEFSTEHFDEENDEEISEDEAFNEEDEDKFGLFFKENEKKKPVATPATELSLSDDEGDDESMSENSDYVDLSQLLDTSSEATLSNKTGSGSEKISFLINEKDDDASDDNSISAESWSDDDDDDASQVDQDLTDVLQNFPSSTPHSKRKRLSERTETFQESEFMAPSQIAEGKKKVKLNDLANVINEESSFGELKRQLKSLEKNTAVTAPLAPRIQDRLERKAAKAETETSVSKWVPIVKKNREADTLIFPMNEPLVENLSSGALVGKFEPFTELEKEIDLVLEESGMTEKKQKEIEELELNKLSKEELAQKRAELAKMRSLLFFKEQKQKKIAKIKSKTYRKITRKAEEKKSLTLNELQTLDPDRAKEEKNKLDFERIKERMTLKHKNTGKWAKKMLGRNEEAGSETHKALMEQLKKGEMLRSRIDGSDSDSLGEDSNEEELLDELEKDIDELPAASKGVLSMKFMQKGLEKQKRELKEAILEARGDLEDERSDGQDEKSMVLTGRHSITKKVSSSSSSLPGVLSNSVTEDLQEGFEVRSSSAKVFKVEPFQSLNQVTAEKTINNEFGSCLEETLNKVSYTNPHNEHEQTEGANTSNSWIKKSANETVLKKSMKESHKVFEKSSKSEKALSKIAKRKKAISNDRTEEHHDVLQDMNLNENNEFDEETAFEDNQLNINQLSNTEIMKIAFANDDVTKEFEIEKNDEEEEDEGENELPGWGDWSGPGLKKRKGKKAQQSVKEKPKKKQNPDLKHVIINDKRQKKAAKYLQTKLPHGFDSREQYERTLLNPLGKEWNTHASHKQLVQPKVVTKLGTVINPLTMKK